MRFNYEWSPETEADQVQVFREQRLGGLCWNDAFDFKRTCETWKALPEYFVLPPLMSVAEHHAVTGGAT